MDTGRYSHLNEARQRLTDKQLEKSWLLSEPRPPDRQSSIMGPIEAKLSQLAQFPGYGKAVSNLLCAQSWDEFMENRWMLLASSWLAQRGALRQMEVELPNGRVPDAMGEIYLNGEPVRFFMEAKSWRFSTTRVFVPDSDDVSIDCRIERMKDKLQRQLPADCLGLWAWDKMRDGFAASYRLGASAPRLGVEERQVIQEVCGAVPQIAAVVVDMPDPPEGEKTSNTMRLVLSPNSKWPEITVGHLVQALSDGNALTTTS